ncbi:MAG: S24 family peptidase [Tepidisphaeraceae bacterium]
MVKELQPIGPDALQGLNVSFPCFADGLAAGFPSAAEGYEDEPLNIHRYLVRNEPATFPFRLVGDLPADHLVDGTILVVDRSVRPGTGKLVIVREDGADYVCRFEECNAGDVRGVVVGAFRRM